PLLSNLAYFSYLDRPKPVNQNPIFMKQVLPFCFSALLLALTFSKAQAQKNDRFAYAITDLTNEGSAWNALRKLDLHTGAYSKVLFNGSDEKTVRYNAISRKAEEQKADEQYGTMLQAPFSTGVAAAAYDRQHNRLYFSPMFIDQLRYIDLSDMKLYSLDQAFTGAGNMHNDEAKVVTRMVISPDGTGYAITNDGQSFVQFTTGKKPAITQLGSLVDDPANDGVSIHTKETSFGGDMISDDAGNLYILSAQNHVFKVNTQTRMATHLGTISGLPQDFTVNGAVVAADGSLLVSSAVDNSGYFSVNPENWQAEVYPLAAAVYRSSDLANGNFIAVPKNQSAETLSQVTVANNGVQVYPNPVTGNRFTVQFSKLPAGDYTIELTDVAGKSLLQKRVVLNAVQQTQAMTLPASSAKGVYLVKITDRSKKSVFEQKVMVQ
ncbi:MAG TPA: T9SS type A sorting domain-containing protein, partial [Chitinophagaceae bacterium]|nr:T9SS type A sorting domain-containing protein [Chitinophagaceae bacterium]